MLRKLLEKDDKGTSTTDLRVVVDEEGKYGAFSRKTTFPGNLYFPCIPIIASIAFWGFRISKKYTTSSFSIKFGIFK